MYLPPEIVKRDDLSGMDKLVYGVIRDIITRTQNDSPLLEAIATAVGGSTRTVTRSIKVLKAADLLVVERQPGIKQVYKLPKQAKPKKKWRDAGEIMDSLEVIDEKLIAIIALTRGHASLTSNTGIHRATDAIRMLLLRKSAKSRWAEASRREDSAWVVPLTKKTRTELSARLAKVARRRKKRPPKSV